MWLYSLLPWYNSRRMAISFEHIGRDNSRVSFIVFLSYLHFYLSSSLLDSCRVLPEQSYHPKFSTKRTLRGGKKLKEENMGQSGRRHVKLNKENPWRITPTKNHGSCSLFYLLNNPISFIILKLMSFFNSCCLSSVIILLFQINELLWLVRNLSKGLDRKELASIESICRINIFYIILVRILT